MTEIRPICRIIRSCAEIDKSRCIGYFCTAPKEIEPTDWGNDMQTRDYRIDILRSVSAFCVVVIHVVSASVTYNAAAVAQATVWQMNVVHNLSSWAVPVFFMITGFCVMGDDRECTWQWTFGHIGKFVGILFTVGWFYALLEYIYMEKSVSLRAVGLALVDVLNGDTWTHMWYIYYIIGIYLVLPVVKSHIVQNQRNVGCLSGLLFLSTILIPAVNGWMGLSIDMHLPMSGYMFYVVTGAMISRCRFSKMKYINAALAAVNVVTVIYVLEHGKDEIYPYTSLPVCMMALSIFALMAWNPVGLHIGRKWVGLSECTLGIYLIHPFFLNLMIKLLHIYPLHGMAWISIPAACMVLYFGSYATVYVLRKLPIVNRLF